MRIKKKKLLVIVSIFTLIFAMAFSCKTYAVNIFPFGDIGWEGTPSDTATSIQIMVFLTLLTLLPSIILTMTSFTRIIIVLSFIRNALGLQQTPPNQVLIGISLFLTLFVMSPVISDIKINAYDPYIANQITQEQAIDVAQKPLREFMLRQTYNKDLNLFLNLDRDEAPESYDDIKMHVLIPAFITSELKRAFQIGFFIFIPFIVIDMVVSSTLMSMGMMMLPPTMVALPFKIMLFVLVDGWNLLFSTLIKSFG